MATFTLIEYDDLNAVREPIEPPFKVSLAQAFDAAVQLASSTAYAKIVPSADACIRFSTAGSAATTAFPKITGLYEYGVEVTPGSSNYVYLTAAA